MTKPNILIVDDELMNRRLLAAILSSEGYAVVEACDGHEALEMIGSREIDLVLLDVMMPRMTGFEACRRIRGELAMPHLPIVFVTALGDRESRIHGKDVGADDFLTKPVDDVELLVRVRSLLRLKAQHDAKEKERLLMSAILDSMSEGVIAVDDARRITLCNPAAERILGAQGAWPDVSDWPGADRVVVNAGGKQAPAPLAHALAGEPTIDQRIQLGPEGDGCHLSVTARPLAASGTSGGGAVAVFRDVTELVALDQFKHEMTSLVVHDLKNIMQVIAGSVECAIDSVDAQDQELQEILRDAQDGAGRAVRLIANLMDVSRLENRAFPLQLQPFDAHDLCRVAVKHRATQLRANGIQLALDPDRAVPRAHGDREVLQRVLDNVLDNAVRYTPQGGEIAIAVAETTERAIQIKIGNTGTPIPVHDHQRIFEKYGRSTARGGGLNAGLGLYFCRLAVAAHGGRIWVESTSRLPTVFVLELPTVASIATAA